MVYRLVTLVGEEDEDDEEDEEAKKVIACDVSPVVFSTLPL